LLGLVLASPELLMNGLSLLGFGTSDALIVANTQNEVNLHNIFNRQFAALYLVPSLLLLAALCYSFRQSVTKLTLARRGDIPKHQHAS
jgi:hypothetical protein